MGDIGDKLKKALSLGGTAVDIATGGATGGLGALVGGVAASFIGGANGLELLQDPARDLPPDSTQPSMLLRAEYQVVDFMEDGRSDLLEDLQSWCADSAPVAVRLYTGPGGTGKTRLFIHFHTWLRDHGWKAGFLTKTDARLNPDAISHLMEARGNAFIVIDYAETRVKVVTKFLRQAALEKTTGKLRVVLIAREAGPWWDSLSMADADIETLLDAAPGPISVPPLSGEHISHEVVFRHAFDSFARTLNMDPALTDIPDIALDDLDNTLLLHMAAFLALHGETLRGTADIRGKVLQHIWNHEERYVLGKASAQGLDSSLKPILFQGLVFATLAGQTEGDTAARALISCTPLCAGQLAATCQQIVTILHGLYPGKGTLNPLQPDILGEHLVEQEYKRDPALLKAFFKQAQGPHVVHGLIVLMRLLARKPDTIDLITGALDAGGEDLFRNLQNTKNLGLLMALEGHLPHTSTALRELAVRVTQTLLDGMKALPGKADRDRQSIIAQLANNLAKRLSESGQRRAALDAINEAVDIYRELAHHNSDAFRPDLASSLNNQATMLSNVGRRNAALDAINEAVDIYRELAHHNSDAFRPDLASSLNNQATMLSNVGRRNAALDAINEAVDIRRELAHHNSDAFRPNLAVSLGAQAQILEAGDRPQDALRAIGEALAILKPLFLASPQAFVRWAGIMLKIYVRLCEATQTDPDGDLISPIVELLQTPQNDA